MKMPYKEKLEIYKQYYSISEVGSLIGEPTFNIRYWEKEKFINTPKKRSSTGDKKYSQLEVQEIILFYYVHKRLGVDCKKAKNVVKVLSIICKLLNREYV